MTESTEELQARLRELDAEIARIRSEHSALIEQVGGSAFGAQDPEDRAAALTNAEESAAILEALHQRRERLEAKLGTSES